MTRIILMTFALVALPAAPALADQSLRPVICSELIADGIPSACLKALAEQRAKAEAEQPQQRDR